MNSYRSLGVTAVVLISCVGSIGAPITQTGEVTEESSSGDPGSDPGDPGSDPGDPGSDPGDPGSDPGDPGSDPGDPGSDPGDPGSDPGDPTVTPGDVGPGPDDPCVGLLTDADRHSMTSLSNPGVGEAVVDPEFGTTIIRITNSGNGGVTKPVYSTVPAWNADETYIVLWNRGSGHALYDGTSYAYIRELGIDPPDLEQVYWSGVDPDTLYWIDNGGTPTLKAYHPSTNSSQAIHSFSGCSSVSGGGDPMYISWDGDVFGLECDGDAFAYTISTNTESPKVGADDAAQASASGALFFVGGDVRDINMDLVRTLDLGNPWDHASLGRLGNGHDAYFGVSFDAGNNSDVGALVAHDMTNGDNWVVVGPATGYPYPPSGIHVSAVAHRNPGWVVISAVGDPSGSDLLDSELILAKTDKNDTKVCRVAHHRSHGKGGPLGYWAEPHPSVSPTATRIVFASDWGGINQVDTYVVELPSYQ